MSHLAIVCLPSLIDDLSRISLWRYKGRWSSYFCMTMLAAKHGEQAILIILSIGFTGFFSVRHFHLAKCHTIMTGCLRMEKLKKESSERTVTEACKINNYFPKLS